MKLEILKAGGERILKGTARLPEIAKQRPCIEYDKIVITVDRNGTPSIVFHLGADAIARLPVEVSLTSYDTLYVEDLIGFIPVEITVP